MTLILIENYSLTYPCHILQVKFLSTWVLRPNPKESLISHSFAPTVPLSLRMTKFNSLSSAYPLP